MNRTYPSRQRFAEGYGLTTAAVARNVHAYGADGITVVHRTWPTLNHSYFGLGGICAAAERAATQAGTDLLHLLDHVVEPGVAGTDTRSDESHAR